MWRCHWGRRLVLHHWLIWSVLLCCSRRRRRRFLLVSSPASELLTGATWQSPRIFCTLPRREEEEAAAAPQSLLYPPSLPPQTVIRSISLAFSLSPNLYVSVCVPQNSNKLWLQINYPSWSQETQNSKNPSLPSSSYYSKGSWRAKAWKQALFFCFSLLLLLLLCFLALRQFSNNKRISHFSVCLSVQPSLSPLCCTQQNSATYFVTQIHHKFA